MWHRPANSRLNTIVPLIWRGGVNFLGGRLYARGRGIRDAPSRQVGTAGNEPRTALVRHIGPGPLDENQQPGTEADEKENMYKQPCQPSDIAGNVHLAEVCHRSGPADRGQAALVPIVK